VQKAVKKAARLAGINKRVTCHTFRHPLVAERLRHSHGARTARTTRLVLSLSKGRENDDDLYPRRQPRRHGGSQPIGFTAGSPRPKVSIEGEPICHAQTMPQMQPSHAQPGQNLP
jgi:hypothetical protein